MRGPRIHPTSTQKKIRATQSTALTEQDAYEIGIGANQPVDAIYPVCMADAEGQPMDGANEYMFHFRKEALPLVGAVWSVTMFDAEGFMVKNKLDRFASGERDGLKGQRGRFARPLHAARAARQRQEEPLAAESGHLSLRRDHAPLRAEGAGARWALNTAADQEVCLPDGGRAYR